MRFFWNCIFVVAVLSLSVQAATIRPKGELCQICQFAVASAEAYIAQNSTEAEVEAFLDRLCDVLPAEFSSGCTGFVNEYLPKAVHFILVDYRLHVSSPDRI